MKKKAFYKISELSGEDRTKLKQYWFELWGNEFAKALVTDYEPSGDMKKTKANSGNRKKVAQHEDVPGMESVTPPTPENNEGDKYNLILKKFENDINPLISSILHEIDMIDYRSLPQVSEWAKPGAEKAALLDHLVPDLQGIVQRIVDSRHHEILAKRKILKKQGK
jgi:hypothetical protein